MQPVAFDFEAFLIQEQQLAPPPVCMSYAYSGVEPGLLHARFDEHQIVQLLERWLTSGEFYLVGANTAFDLAVAAAWKPHLLEMIFYAYERGAVVDVLLTEQLADLAIGKMLPGVGRYGLGQVARRVANIDLDKENPWRLKYGTLIDVPTHLWDKEAVDYSKLDSGATLYTHQCQIQRPAEFLVDVIPQGRAAWWAQLMMCTGFRTDQQYLGHLRRHIQRQLEQLTPRMMAYGLVRYDGTQDQKAIKARIVEACEKAGIAPKMTKKGQISMDEEICLDTKDKILSEYATWSSLQTIWTKDIPALAAPIIQSRFTTLKDTGRMGCSGGKGGKGKKKSFDPLAPKEYQLHNVRREPGVREVFVPMPGCNLLSVDYGQFELHGWAECCMQLLGYSELGKALNAGTDVHVLLGADTIGVPYEQVYAGRKSIVEYADARQMAKAGNFGFPGGLGAPSFMAYAKANWGLVITEEQAVLLRERWLARWVEAEEYFRYIRDHLQGGSYVDGIRALGTFKQVGSNRIRGEIPYTVAANGFFQALAADCMKEAGFYIAKACYIDRNSPLYGSRLHNAVHDEFLLSVPEPIAHECAQEVVRIMEVAGRKWMPHVPPRAEPALMTRWRKKAEPKYNEVGRLIPWEPKTLKEGLMPWETQRAA